MNLPLDPEARAALERRVPAGGPRPRVLLLRSLRPPRAAEPIAADLIALIGGDSFRATPDGRSSGVLGVLDFSKPWTLEALASRPSARNEGFLPTWEEVLEFDPQLVILSLEERERGAGLREWMSVDGWNRIEAARTERIILAKDGLCRPNSELAGELRWLQGLMGIFFWGWSAEASPD